MEITEPITLRVTARDFRSAVAALKVARAKFDPADKTWTFDPADLPVGRRIAGTDPVPLTEYMDAIGEGIEAGRYEIVD